MRNGPTMSYCAIRNVNQTLGQIIDVIGEHGNIDDWLESISPDERHAWRSLMDKIEIMYQEFHDENVA